MFDLVINLGVKVKREYVMEYTDKIKDFSEEKSDNNLNVA